MKQSIAVILIGRNEGDRLVRCLSSVPPAVGHVVYVDSGSTDDSVANAQAAGATIVSLDTSTLFTAARARNEGFAALDAMAIDYVQFVDGDCEIQAGWIETAHQFLQENPQAAVACGRRRERFPDATIYNRLCDWEWDTPIGQAKACGGDAMMRVKAFTAVGGFDPTLIAGEEPELCFRLRKAEWEIHRLDHEMTLHDAAMTQFNQWVKRAQRSGHASAEAATLYGGPDETYPIVSTRRAVIWAIVIPILIIAGLLMTPWALFLLLVYPAQILRLALRDGADRHSWERAFFLTIGKFPEARGVLEYYWRRLRHKPSELIEYK